MKIFRMIFVCLAVYCASVYVCLMAFSVVDNQQIFETWYGEKYSQEFDIIPATTNDFTTLNAKITLTLSGRPRYDVFACINGKKMASFADNVVILKVADGDLLEIKVDGDISEPLEFTLSTTSPLVDMKFLPLNLEVNSSRKIWSRVEFVK